VSVPAPAPRRHGHTGIVVDSPFADQSFFGNFTISARRDSIVLDVNLGPNVGNRSYLRFTGNCCE
jgi:hypothetical protein